MTRGEVLHVSYNAFTDPDLSMRRLKLSEQEIKKQVPAANIRRLTLDLSSLEATRKAAAEVNAYPLEVIHVLINNAAAPIVPFKLTVDKLENQIATDHVGPFLFTNLIAPKILAARTSTYTPRVVFVSSMAYTFGSGIDLSYIEKPDSAQHGNMNSYIQAKTANILTAIELSKRSKGKINSYSLHPGGQRTYLSRTQNS